MRLAPRWRRLVLFGLLGFTVAAMKWVDGEPQVTASAQAREEAARTPRETRPEARPVQQAPAAGLDPSRLRRESIPVRTDAFGTRNWDPPPPKALRATRVETVVAPPPPPPQAPPLPFTYLGRLDEGDRTTVFLAGPAQDHAVTAGQVIDGVYRVDEITPQRVVVTYLPLGQQQSLSIGPP